MSPVLILYDVMTERDDPPLKVMFPGLDVISQGLSLD